MKIIDDFFGELGRLCLGKKVQFLEPDDYAAFVGPSANTNENLCSMGIANIETDETIYLLLNLKPRG